MIERIKEAPHRFAFVQLLQLIERLRPDAAPIGRQGPAEREAVRLRPALTMAFPHADVVNVEVSDDEQGRPRFTIETTFLGLYGTASPLPNFVTEDLLQDDPDESLVRPFLDIFHHRFLSLFYRGWRKYRHSVQYEAEARDEMSRCFLAFTGRHVLAPAAGSALPAPLALRYAGLLARRPTSAAALEGLVSDYFAGLAAHVTCCVARQVSIAPQSWSLLGAANCRPGFDMLAGERFMDRAGGFRITVGPMGWRDYERFLPGGAAACALGEIVAATVSDWLDPQLELVLVRDEVPPLVLGSSEARVGHSAWLGRPEHDAVVRFPLEVSRRAGTVVGAA